MKWLIFLLLLPIAFSAEFPKEIKVNYNVSTFCIPVFSNISETIEIFFRGINRIEKIEPCKVNYFCYDNFAKKIGKEYAYINGTKITIDFGNYNRTDYFLNLNTYYCPAKPEDIKELEKLRRQSININQYSNKNVITEVVKDNQTIVISNNEHIITSNPTFLIIAIAIPLSIAFIIYFIKRNLLI